MSSESDVQSKTYTVYSLFTSKKTPCHRHGMEGCLLLIKQTVSQRSHTSAKGMMFKRLEKSLTRKNPRDIREGIVGFHISSLSRLMMF